MSFTGIPMSIDLSTAQKREDFVNLTVDRLLEIAINNSNSHNGLAGVKLVYSDAFSVLFKPPRSDTGGVFSPLSDQEGKSDKGSPDVIGNLIRSPDMTQNYLCFVRFIKSSESRRLMDILSKGFEDAQKFYIQESISQKKHDDESQLLPANRHLISRAKHAPLPAPILKQRRLPART